MAFAQSSQQGSAVALPPVVVGSPQQARQQQSANSQQGQARRRSVRASQRSRNNPAVANPGPAAPEANNPWAARLLLTPSSTSSMNAQQIEQTGTRNQRDLAQTFSNVTGFDSGGNRMTSFTIRGMREFGYQSTPGVYPAVAYYMDDVPALTTLARASLFMNTDQINVLRGPQNAGYGFSRPGGVIDVRSAEPTKTPSAYLGGSYGNYSAYETSGGLSTPIAPQWFLSVDGIVQGRDGFYNNTALNDSYGDKSGLAGRAKLTWTPTSQFQVDFISQHERFRDQTDPFVPLSQLKTNPFTVSYNDPGHERISQDLEALRIKASFDSFDLLSVSSYRRSTWDFVNDGDGTAAPLDPGNPYSRFSGYTSETVRSATQEVRLKSNDSGARLQWSGGIFAAKTDMDIGTGLLLYPSGQMIDPAKASNGDFAGYGELSYALTNALRIVPGLRYEWADRKASNAFLAPTINSGSDTFSAVLPSLALVYAPVENLSSFIKYTRGFRPGGFNAHKQVTDPGQYAFDSETSDNFEIGFKSNQFANRLTLSGSLFLSNFENYQVLNQFSATSFGVNNAQKVRTYGGEFEASYKLMPELRIFTGVGLTQARYLEFVNSYGDFSHNDVAFVPRFTLNYGVEYQAGWGGFAGVQARTTGRYALDDANHSSQGTTTVVNAQIGYRKNNYEVAVFGRNIFDERYVVNVYDFAGTGIGAFGNLGDPATYGVRAKVTF